MLCIPIIANSRKEFSSKIIQAQKKVNIITLRVDTLPEIKRIDRLFKLKKRPYIIHNKLAQFGGKFTGTTDENLEVLSEFVRFKPDFIEVELQNGLEFIKNIQKRLDKTSLIVSDYDFENTPDLELLKVKVLEIKEKIWPAIIKIITKGTSTEDNLTLLNLTQWAKKELGQKVIAFADGKKGQLSRILTPYFGWFLTELNYSKGDKQAHSQLHSMQYKKIVHLLGLKVWGKKTVG